MGDMKFKKLYIKKFHKSSGLLKICANCIYSFNGWGTICKTKNTYWSGWGDKVSCWFGWNVCNKWERGSTCRITTFQMNMKTGKEVIGE